MPYKYRYAGDLPTVFITLRKNGRTWVPSKGETINSTESIAHPLLELVVKEPPVGSDEKSADKAKKPSEPVLPEIIESPATADDKEN